MTADAQSRETASVEAEDVRAYLEAHPDFLATRPELLTAMEIPDDTAATSLLEYQVSVLRDRNQELSRRLRQYHEVADANAALLERIHGLYARMLRATTLEELIRDVLERLRSEFRCDAAVLAVFGDDAPAGCLALGAETVAEEFGELKRRPEPACGRISSERRERLFGEAAGDIQSVALAPLDASGERGLLALGSRDEHRFHPGMGTLFISLLGQMMGQNMARLEPGETDTPS